MIRISATQLEAYRRWLESEEATIEEMVAYLEKKVQPNEAMLAGSAFHKVLEDYENMTLAFVEKDGFKFDFSEIDTEIHIPRIKEFKFEIAMHPVTLREMANKEEIPAYKIGRKWKFDVEELEKFLKKDTGNNRPHAIQLKVRSNRPYFLMNR
ncbi:helix-turn-helix domain-containing protein [Aggregatibacter actinomycetemcomitans]|uniref:helix-turn-helix domain-containing protein n=1 Tax=Aggregatibacter actinomycetemcomitans TaxID=714 RepID=UPI0021CC70B7|nr:helix-turn-helix domain-containing protein [Aggregatibacter actinomycetemcomitans]